MPLSIQGNDILQHSQNRETKDRRISYFTLKYNNPDSERKFDKLSNKQKYLENERYH